jgi:tubulin-specific chaperone C
MSSLTEPDSFLCEFEKRVAQIRARVSSANTSADVDAVSLELNDVHNFLAEGAYILPAYDIRRSNETLAELGAACQDKSETLTPRLPFRFRHRRALKEQSAPTKISLGLAGKHVLEESCSPGTHHEGSGTEKLDKVPLLTAHAVEIKDMTGESRIQLPADRFRDRDVSLARLRGCTVYLCGVASAVRGVDLVDCQLYIGPVAGSVHLTSCVGCEVHAAARQVRIHTSVTHCNRAHHRRMRAACVRPLLFNLPRKR